MNTRTRATLLGALLAASALGTLALAPTSSADDSANRAPAAPASTPRRAANAPQARTPAPAANAAQPAPRASLTADDALKLLREGNRRWVTSQATAPNTDASRRSTLAERGQQPFVTIVGCADSRVPLERVFDRGVGDVFVVRLAGNVVGGAATGTVEYGVEHLKTPLLVVLGHTKCGAVAAAASGAQLHGALGGLVDSLRPAVDRAKRLNPELTGDALVRAAINENVWQSAYALLRDSSVVRDAVRAGRVTIVGAVYDISTGEVTFMGQHPWQTELLETIASATPATTATQASTTASAGATTQNPAPASRPQAAPANTPAQTHADAHAAGDADHR